MEHRTLTLALDGTNLAHRVFHAGSPTKDAVIAGLIAFTARLVAATSPERLVVALDAAGGCPSRRTLAPEYKAGRKPTDPALRAALDELPAMFAELGLSAPAVVGWEADDVLATVAHEATQTGGRVILVSSDKDLHQLIGPQCSIMKPEGTVVDVAALRDRYGVDPGRWVEFAALVGEGADNLPGVPGVGPKRAAALLAAVADVEHALADPSVAREPLGPAGAASLVSHADRFRTNRLVGTLRRDLGPLPATALAGIDPRALAASAARVGVDGVVGQLTAVVLRMKTRAA